MLESVKITRRQSEIRQALAELVAKPAPTEDEARQMGALDTEYRTNETRYRAALVSEDNERREAGADLETRGSREWAEMIAGFELRHVALALDEGRSLEGRTAEIVQELRASGGFRGIPVPWQALEARAGETLAADVPDPLQTRPIIDRLFPDSVAGHMGAQMIYVDHGSIQWPVVTSIVTAGWQPTELGPVPGPQTFTTTDKALSPDHTLGVHMRISRKAMKQAGEALEQAVRRDMSGAIAIEMDRAVFQGSGANGQPLGVITGAATYGIRVSALDETASWAAFRAAAVRFMVASTAGSPVSVRALIRPELWAYLDDTASALPDKTEWARFVQHIPAGNIVMSPNALAAPTGPASATSALLTTTAGGVPPIFIRLWGAIDLIRDPYTDAQSGVLRLTGLATMDVTVARPAQLEVLNGLELAVAP